LKIRALLTAMLLACWFAAAAPAVAKSADDDVQIDIVANGDWTSWRYSPTTLTVQAGTTVTWKNVGSQAVSVTSRDQLFDSHLLDPGKSWSYTFDTPGTFRYFCVPYPWMKGTLIVAPDDDDRHGSSPPPAGGASSSGPSSSGSGSTATGSAGSQPTPTPSPSPSPSPSASPTVP
jgi:plastocyanin